MNERLPALSPMVPPTVSTPGTESIRAAASSAAAVVSAKELPSGIVSVTIICSISISGRNVKPLVSTAAPLATSSTAAVSSMTVLWFTAQRTDFLYFGMKRVNAVSLWGFACARSLLASAGTSVRATMRLAMSA